MRDFLMSKDNFKLIHNIFNPIQIGTLERKYRFSISVDNDFFFLPGLWESQWEGPGDYEHIKKLGKMYMNSFIDLYDCDFLILRLESIIDKDVLEIHPVGEGADFLLERLKELRSSL